ncbi:MAG TPA: molecular chaperone DnaJ [Candidatus Polarisedimenticolaceae bacterium]|nr:molecular chaperone DnaJ [Candidatus Polarisedimenticolaceae bacterium]
MASRGKKDYYETLGVPRNADAKQIKAAYRRLARKYHPDVNKGDKAAEERFKEVAEAFAVLSDAERRAQYDRRGHEAFGQGFDPFAGVDVGNFDLGDLGSLFDLFGGFGSRRPARAQPQRGEDLGLEVRVPFLDAMKGATLELEVPRRVACEVCGGSGHRPGTGETACPDCGGSGRREQQRRSFHVSATCARCGGSGRLPGEACAACRGSGTGARQERVKVRIPPGVEDGATVRVRGKGDAGQRGGNAGELYLQVHVEPHPLFRREGRDLICDVPIGLAAAGLGGEISVPTLEGSTRIRVPAGTPSGRRLRIAGKGVPGSATDPAGDLYAVIQISPPPRLDARSRELLEEFARLNPTP